MSDPTGYRSPPRIPSEAGDSEHDSQSSWQSVGGSTDTVNTGVTTSAASSVLASGSASHMLDRETDQPDQLERTALSDLMDGLNTANMIDAIRMDQTALTSLLENAAELRNGSEISESEWSDIGSRSESLTSSSVDAPSGTGHLNHGSGGTMEETGVIEPLKQVQEGAVKGEFQDTYASLRPKQVKKPKPRRLFEAKDFLKDEPSSQHRQVNTLSSSETSSTTSDMPSITDTSPFNILLPSSRSLTPTPSSSNSQNPYGKSIPDPLVLEQISHIDSCLSQNNIYELSRFANEMVQECHRLRQQIRASLSAWEVMRSRIGVDEVETWAMDLISNADDPINVVSVGQRMLNEVEAAKRAHKEIKEERGERVMRTPTPTPRQPGTATNQQQPSTTTVPMPAATQAQTNPPATLSSFPQPIETGNPRTDGFGSRIRRIEQQQARFLSSQSSSSQDSSDEEMEEVMGVNDALQELRRQLASDDTMSNKRPRGEVYYPYRGLGYGRG